MMTDEDEDFDKHHIQNGEERKRVAAVTWAQVVVVVACACRRRNVGPRTWSFPSASSLVSWRLSIASSGASLKPCCVLCYVK